TPHVTRSRYRARCRAPSHRRPAVTFIPAVPSRWTAAPSRRRRCAARRAGWSPVTFTDILPDRPILRRSEVVMTFPRSLVLFLLVAIAVVPVAADEPFPVRPITIVNPFPPGGQVDLTSRPLAAA